MSALTLESACGVLRKIRLVISAALACLGFLVSSAGTCAAGPGDVDPDFAPYLPTGVVNVVVLQPDGKIIAAGSSIMRFNADGTTDTNWNSPALLSGPGLGIRAAVIQSNGQVVVVVRLSSATLSFESVPALENLCASESRFGPANTPAHSESDRRLSQSTTLARGSKSHG